MGSFGQISGNKKSYANVPLRYSFLYSSLAALKLNTLPCYLCGTEHSSAAKSSTTEYF
jgi:hypothetical protein